MQAFHFSSLSTEILFLKGSMHGRDGLGTRLRCTILYNIDTEHSIPVSSRKVL